MREAVDDHQVDDRAGHLAFLAFDPRPRCDAKAHVLLVLGEVP
jgi:hypothetical protein